MVFPSWMCRGSPYARSTPHTVIVKSGKKAQLIWDGTTKNNYWETTMNEKTDMESKAIITFGCVLIVFIAWVWRLQMAYPREIILLGFVDLSTTFRLPRFFADMCGAFGFKMGLWYFAANEIVFGSVASASFWEPFWREIGVLALAYFYRKGLVQWSPNQSEVLVH